MFIYGDKDNQTKNEKQKYFNLEPKTQGKRYHHYITISEAELLMFGLTALSAQDEPNPAL